MRILCLFISHLPVQVEERDPTTPQGGPLIIGGLPHERKAVYDASPPAIERGVKTGMPLRHAYSLCPEARFLPTDTREYELAFEEVMEIMASFSPVVERHELGTAFLDASGMGSYYRGEDNLVKQLLGRVRSKLRITASAAITGNKFTAKAAAALTRPGESTLVPPGGERNFLAPLPVDTLPCPQEMKRQLHLLGIRRVDELVGLGSQPMTTQFGKEGLLLHQLACGIDESPLVPRQKPDRIERAVDFDPPVNTLDGFLAGISGAVDSLSEGLKERWQLCRRMELSLQFDSGRALEKIVHLKAPTLSRRTFLSLIRLRLEQARVESPISAVNITLSGLCKDGSQLYFGNTSAGRKQQIAPAVREIKSRWGKNMIKKPVLLHQEAFLPEQRFTFQDVKL